MEDIDTSELIRIAIRKAGGTQKVAQAMGLKSHESVRKMYVQGVPAERARDLIEAVGGGLTLAQVRPDLWAGLTQQELGYPVTQ